jgi:hypothetical protein
VEPLPLQEYQRVTVTVSDPAERWLDHEYMESVRKDVAVMGPAPSLEEVRQALSKIPGWLSDDIRAEREGRSGQPGFWIRALWRSFITLRSGPPSSRNWC